MTALEYIKRALRELTGNKKAGKRSSHPDFINNQTLILFVVVGALLVLVIGGILMSGQQTSSNNQAECIFKIPEENGPTSLKNVCVVMEKALTPSKHRLGLSNRPSLPRNSGMLFDFKSPQKSCMWMKDMNFSLDMMWLDESGEIVAVKENVSPKTYPAAFCGPNHARYVIEVNAGIIKEAELEKGNKLDI